MSGVASQGVSRDEKHQPAVPPDNVAIYFTGDLGQNRLSKCLILRHRRQAVTWVCRCFRRHWRIVYKRALTWAG